MGNSFVVSKNSGGIGRVCPCESLTALMLETHRNRRAERGYFIIIFIVILTGLLLLYDNISHKLGHLSKWS